MTVYRLITAALLLAATAVSAQVTLPAESHPGLLFTEDQVSLLQERITREPYATWWATVLSRAENPPNPVTEERTKARYAKAAAFAWWMTGDSTFAHTSAGLLLDMKFPRDDGDLGEPHNEGEVVMQYAQAYDMLHVFLADYPDSLATVRDLLADEADRMFDGIVVEEIDLGFLGTLKIRLHETTDPRNLSVTHLDNWHVRLYGGLGMAAYALADHSGSGGSDPQEWADWAHDLVTRSLAHVIETEDGGYAESPFYQRYAADVYLPYAFALRALSDIDLFSDPLLDKTHDWSVNIRLPSGRRPNTDDGHIDDTYGHYLAAVDADGAVHHWDWLNNENGPYVRGFNEPDAIVYYDDTQPSQEPTRGPTIFMPAAGDAVFRTDWSEEATYLLLRGEHGRTREQGFGHEHADETSFILYAHGEMLAVDGGYINFTNHDKVNWGNAHSLIMVDGQGPPLDRIAGAAVDGGEDAYIEDTLTHAAGDYAEVRAEYLGARIRRRVLFADREYFVIADEARSDSARAYEWRLHGHGGGTSGGSYSRDGSLARWTRTNAELLAYLPQQTGRTFAEQDTIHSFDYLEEPTHTFLQVTETDTTAEFLSVLFPRATLGEEPALTTATSTGGQAIGVSRQDGAHEVAWSKAAGADSVTVDSVAGAELSSDAAFGWLRAEGDTIRTWSIQDGTWLRAGGTVRLSASDTVDVLLTVAADSVGGFVRGADTGYDIVLNGIDSVLSAQFDGFSTTATRLESSLWQLSLSGSGHLLLTTVSPDTGSTDTTTTPSDTTVTDPGDTVVVPVDSTVTDPGDTTVTDAGDTVVVSVDSTVTDPGDTTVTHPGDTVVVPVDSTVVDPGDTTVTDPGDTVVVPVDSTVTDPGDTTVVAPGDTVTVAPEEASDFSGDGVVDFSDFFQFADVFGQSVSGEDARFDLNDDGMVDFSDFFIFADAFSKPAD